jgi:hypothetical protein
MDVRKVVAETESGWVIRLEWVSEFRLEWELDSALEWDWLSALALA